MRCALRSERRWNVGIRSDVALAVHRDLDALISDEQRKAWFTDCARPQRDDGHRLYVWHDCKWYMDDYPEIVSMYEWLRAQDASLFKIVEACLDYPDGHQGDLGRWDDNPWGIERVVSVSIAGI